MKKHLLPKALVIITGLIFVILPLIQTGNAETTEGKTMIIEGVGRLQWGKGMESTYMGALTVAMKAMGEDVTYDYLMGISGAAFRLHIHHPGWCPSAPDATCGFNHGIPAMKAMGYKVTGINSDGNKPEDVEKVRKAVMESIDKGYPILAIDLKQVPDWGVIVGYTDGGKEFLCRTYYDKTEEYSKSEKWPWVVDVIKEKIDKPDEKESILESLKIAIEIANAEKYEDYASGFNAYEVWINDLLNDSMFESADKDKLVSMIHANAWSYSSLGDARSAAIKYLHSISSFFGAESTQHIAKAIEIYEKILEKLKDGFKYAPYPGQLKDGEQWTAEMRHAEAGVLKEVLALEKEAIDQLKAALKWEDEVTGQVRPDSLTRLALYNLELPDIPYSGAGVPSAFIQALKHSGIETDYAELTAVSGWAFSFSYKYDNWHVAALPVEDFTFLPEHLGYSVESIRCGDRDKFWDFIKQNIDAGRPVISTYTDGGLIYGYRVKEGKRQLWFDGSICLDWINIEAPHPLDSCAVLIKSDKEHPREIVIHDALAQAVEKASPHENNGVPQGLAALEAYLADVADETKDFKNVDEWFCWGAFERLCARWCCANWLRRAADVFQGEAHDRILNAADYYENAFKLYDQYRQELQKPDNRLPERIAVVVPILRKAINEEQAGIEEMKKALATDNSKKEEKTGMKEGKKLVIDNVDRYRVMDPVFEGVRVIMSYRGEKYSPEYIQGISGAAFRISGICPCATTCSWMMNPYDLPKLLGYETDCVFLNQEGIDKKAVLNDIIAQVKEEINAGRPVSVWNAFTTAEWDVVCGFDDEKKQFIGRGSYEGLDGYAIADENRTAEWIPSWPSAIFIKDKVDEFNAQEAEIASLKEAVKHAHTIKEIPADGKWVRLEGLQCYDRWVNDFQDPDKKRELGDLCCISTYHSTHRAAGGFMKELMPKYPEAKENLEKASEYFVAEANALDQCDGLIGHNTPEGPDADRNAKTAKLLKQARDNYANAINEIEEALKKIER